MSDIKCPHNLVDSKCNTFVCTHWMGINSYYESITKALSGAADSCIPVVYGDVYKHYWSQELSDLKWASVEAHNLWIANGRPNNRVINAIRRDAKYKYKLALRHAQKIETCKVDE